MALVVFTEPLQHAEGYDRSFGCHFISDIGADHCLKVPRPGMARRGCLEPAKKLL